MTCSDFFCGICVLFYVFFNFYCFCSIVLSVFYCAVWSDVSFWPNLSFVVNVTKISKLAKNDFIFIRKETELALVDAAHDGVERRNCYMNSMGALHGIAYF